MNRDTILFAAALSTLAACGDSGPKDVTITFATLVAGQPFSCTSVYADVGTGPDAAARVFTPQDMRYYVHDVRLVKSSGEEEPVSLSEDGAWQHAGVALLDFEDASGTCVAGDVATNVAIEGTAPAGDYTGLAFRVGVPEALNHLKVDDQPSPLNRSALYWNWTGGYKFTRIEGTTVGALLHLGSTGCTPVDANDLALGASCTNSNRAEVRLAQFDVAADTVVLDIATLFGGSDLAFNTTGTAKGCMSGTTDPECVPMFARLGLAFGDAAAGTQSVFANK